MYHLGVEWPVPRSSKQSKAKRKQYIWLLDAVWHGIYHTRSILTYILGVFEDCLLGPLGPVVRRLTRIFMRNEKISCSSQLVGKFCSGIVFCFGSSLISSEPNLEGLRFKVGFQAMDPCITRDRALLSLAPSQTSTSAHFYFFNRVLVKPSTSNIDRAARPESNRRLPPLLIRAEGPNGKKFAERLRVDTVTSVVKVLLQASLR
ncbi:hypothetical protein B0H14DRAFT_2632990 [Mycena olivaceomarginata]|nr:hypothetical protein B0H14DRAFT_2632990 [Mycena olivaceomarginata]